MSIAERPVIAAPEKLLWELGPAQPADYLPEFDAEPAPELARSGGLRLPKLAELQVVRHFKALAAANFSIDRMQYPLGSCTMKYNPKISENLAQRPEIVGTHPSVEDPLALALLWHLQDFLERLTGFAAVSLQPAAGAQAEFAALLMIRAALRERGELQSRRKIIIPDSAHGTNPASTTMAGFEPVVLKTGSKGIVEPAELAKLLGEDTAGIMITNPNTLGIFERHIREIAAMVREAGGYVYGDGANYNAIAGKVRPAELGLDLMHINVHKTFGTPHGGGGPGAGPLCAAERMVRFLPGPLVRRLVVGGKQEYRPWVPERSVGRVHENWGNFGILVRALCYLWGHGAEGIRSNSEQAVLNANYVMRNLADEFPAAFPGTCMHEFVAENPLMSQGIRTLDIAKRLLDFGIHAPTVYFPLIVREALMIEPTESESLEELDRFVAVMKQIAEEARENPEVLRSAPNNLPFSRVDEVQANRKLRLIHRFGEPRP